MKRVTNIKCPHDVPTNLKSMEIMEYMNETDRLKLKGCQGLHINKENKFSSTRKGSQVQILYLPQII